MEGNDVLIISDHLLFAQAIRQMLAARDVHVGPIVRNVGEALSLIPRVRPAVIIVDADPETDRDALVAQLLGACGEACRVLFVSLDNTDINVYIHQRVAQATDTELIALIKRALPTPPCP